MQEELRKLYSDEKLREEKEKKRSAGDAVPRFFVRVGCACLPCHSLVAALAEAGTDRAALATEEGSTHARAGEARAGNAGREADAGALACHLRELSAANARERRTKGARLHQLALR